MQSVQSRDGVTIAYDQSGSGAPVILVGGAFQDRQDQMIASLAARLAPHFTVLAYDRRGRGGSSDTAPYAVAREVDDIAALIDAAGGTARVFGMSSGAILTLHAAASGLPITQLALYEPPFVVDAARQAMPVDMAARLSALVKTGRRGDAVELFLTEGVGVPAAMVAGMRQQPVWPGMEAIAPTLVYDCTIVGDSTIPPEVASITQPTLVMDGGASPEWARNSVQALAEMLPNARRQTLPDQTHAVDTALLAPALVEFFTA